ncbi:MAG: hypothetical protein ACYTDX_00100 [Planctomycetota bacterium]
MIEQLRSAKTLRTALQIATRASDPWHVYDVVGQDEYNHDVILRRGWNEWIVLDCT